MRWRAKQLEVVGTLEGPKRLPIRVNEAHAHSLVVSFLDERPDNSLSHFDQLTLSCNGRETKLGPCLFDGRKNGHQRKDDPPPILGDGSVVFDASVYDFRQLFKTGRIIPIGERLEQLPPVLHRQAKVGHSFRHLVSKILYDLQVFRSVFDELDRNLDAETEDVREAVRSTAADAHYHSFSRFFDERLALLESESHTSDRETHALHGYFFRKQMWDLIASSEFLLRTNLKPRGYAGDSEMMRMVYENTFRGPTVFSRFMHRHPIDTPAANAVRNRRALLAKALRNAREKVVYPSKARILSVACGPAWELSDVFTSIEDCDKYALTLMDQDPQALQEAKTLVGVLEQRFNSRIEHTVLQDSIRTMLRTSDPSAQWGQFELVYSMGLFDYLTQPVAKAIVAKLYLLLAPGGELIIGNFHVGNPTRTYMEYWMDWVLWHRTEDELADLARHLPGAQISISFESTRSQMFLKVIRT
jgi:extracellular factor (EF) 3-hydroxypalmitic acid methyl ester biosynthesis protein